MITINKICANVFSLHRVAATPISMTSRGHVFVVNPGQPVEIRCEFEMVDYDLFENPIVLNKHQQHESTQINIMGNLFEPFLSTGRFKVSFSINEPRYAFTLRIDSK